jgi:hypothetical protein
MIIIPYFNMFIIHRKTAVRFVVEIHNKTLFSYRIRFLISVFVGEYFSSILRILDAQNHNHRNLILISPGDIILGKEMKVADGW